MPRSVMIFAGGTGGHVFPGIAVAEALRRSGVELHWVGTKRGLESRVVPAAGIPFQCVSVSGVRRSGWLRLLMSPFQLLFATLHSLILILRIRPSVVLGMGGFVSGPGGVAAWMSGRALLIHEQNAIAGLTNRWLSRIADVAMQAFPDALEHGKEIRLTGNPIRHEIAGLDTPGTRMKRTGVPRILVFGGSRGAHALNRNVPVGLGRLQDLEFEILHQCGVDQVEETRRHYRDSGLEKRVEVVPFIEDMAAAYATADVVVARSGALTIAEIAAAGIAAILVPYPFAVDDHQTLNAQYLVSNDAALLIRENELSGDGLPAVLSNLIRDFDLRLSMAERARALAVPNAAALVAECCLEYANV